MKRALRRYGTGIVLCLAGALLLLTTAASLGYVDVPGQARSAAPPPAAARDPASGLELDLAVDLDAPLVPADPLAARVEPPLASAVPMPGASVHRDLSVERAGLGLHAELDLAAGSHRAQPAGAGDALATTAREAVLAPPVAPAAVAAAALTLAGALAYFWTSVKSWMTRLALVPALLLYAKITRAQVFDNGVRERIFAAIRATPGASASELARAAQVSWGTTIYHLDVLEQTRMVTSLRKGRYRRYFENGALLAGSKDAVAILRNPVTAGIVETLRRAPGATQKELAGAVGLTPQALHWHLARLVETGLVRKERDGRVVRHFPAA